MNEPANEDAPAIDAEVAALLDFEPVPRKRAVADGWTLALQREFITRLASHGSPGKACEEMGKNLTGMMKLYRSPLAASFRGAWDGAIALARRRAAERSAREFVAPGSRAPTIDNRVRHRPAIAGPQQSDDEDERRYEEARNRISRKLLSARRLYLSEICDSAGKRAAFEILTQYPIDWERARRLEAQDDEPWRHPNMRKPDMLLTAENGWLAEMAHGPDKKAELRRDLNEYLVEQGMEPIDWDAEDEE